MAYFDTKSGSLEEAIRQAVGGKINEKLDAVNPKAAKKKFDDRKDKDIDNDGDVDSSDKFLHKRRKAIGKAMQTQGEEVKYPHKMYDPKTGKEVTAKTPEDHEKYNKMGYTHDKPKMEGLEDSPNPANSQHLCAKNVVHEEWGEGNPVHGQHADPDENGDIAWYDVMFEHGIEKGVSINELKVTKAEDHHHGKVNSSKKPKKKDMEENYELGTPENTKAKLDATPGQSSDEWQQQVDAMQKKNISMREALAKMWGVDEGHNPFDKKEEKKYNKDKKENKTMTGKPMTKVSVDPDMKEVKIGKKTVR